VIRVVIGVMSYRDYGSGVIVVTSYRDYGLRIVVISCGLRVIRI
jgi:hypothetical protein